MSLKNYKSLGVIGIFITSLVMTGWAQNVSVNATGNAPDASSGLDVDFTNKGVLIPRVALTATNSATPISSPTTSLMVYNTATTGSAPNNVTPGFYYWNGTKWIAFDGDGGDDWSLTGNAGTVDGTNFIGTTDNVPVNFRVNNLESGQIDNSIGSTFFGYRAGESNTTGGTNNTAMGFFALNANTTGDQNTAIAQSALATNTTGSFNTATGFAALGSNTTGQTNTANGLSALTANTIGSANVAVGTNTMASNTTAGLNTAVGAGALFTQSFSNSSTAWNSENVAIGHEALYFNQPTATTVGIRNVAVGNSALRANTIGAYNTAVGVEALVANTQAIDNTAIGYRSMQSATTGGFNTAVGVLASRDLETGIRNVAVGMQALLVNVSADDNTAIGTNALLATTGAGNTAVGRNAMDVNTTGTNNTTIGFHSDVSSGALTNATAIGYNAKVATSNSVVLGGTGTEAANVGIGTTSPNFKLVVDHEASHTHRGIFVGDEASAQAVIVPITSESPDIGLASFGYNHYASSSGQLNYNAGTNVASGAGFQGGIKFWTAPGAPGGSALTPNIRMTIENGGDVGIGTTNPAGLFELSLDEGRKPSTTTWTTTSDSRLKNIEGEYKKGLEEVLQLEPITYYYKNVGERKFEDEVLETLNVGFSAQDVQKIFPEAVGVDEDGYLNFNMHAILVAYTNAIKEQQQIIEAQNIKIENLSSIAVEFQAHKRATNLQLKMIEEYLKTTNK